MDENIQHDITQICIALLQKSAASELKARQFFVVGESDEEGLRRLKELEAQRPKTKKEATALLLQTASHPDITMKDMLDALEVLYFRSKSVSQTRQWIIQLLRDLLARDDSTASDAIEIATELYVVSPPDSYERQEALEYLLAMARRRDIPFTDTVEAAHSLYVQSPRGSKEKQQAADMLLEQAHWPDTTAAQAEEAALALCHASSSRMKEKSQAIEAAIEVYHRPNLSFEDAVALDCYGPENTSFGMIAASTKTLEQQQREAKRQMWEAVAQRPDLTAEQRAKVDTILAAYTHWSFIL
jgi:hypothetical protein